MKERLATQLAIERQKAREESRFDEADKIRDELHAAGWQISDTRKSYRLWRN